MAQSVRTVSSTVNLKGATLTLKKGESLRFEGKGCIKNGKVEGNGGSLEAVEPGVRLKNVQLTGSWSGAINDQIFYYNEGKKNHFSIVSSMLKFNDVQFTRSRYYLEKWETIYLNKGNDVIEGNGVTFIITSSKGKYHSTDWGNKYNVPHLISSSGNKGAELVMRNINIVDNSKTVSGWGENVSRTDPVIYSYIYPYHPKMTFENINSDGCGGLFGTYNTNADMGYVIIKDCNIKTSQFAIELINKYDAAKKTTGRNALVQITGCDIYRYPNALFVGAISLVSLNAKEHLLKKAVISNNKIYESNIGNLELSAVAEVELTSNTMHNEFCYSGDTVPDSYLISNNTFEIGTPDAGGINASLKLGGKNIDFRGNTIRIVSAPFPFIEVKSPSRTQKLDMTGNEIDFSPNVNSRDHHSYLFKISSVGGTFQMYGNKFKSKYSDPAFNNYLPTKHGKYENMFPKNVNNHN